MTKKLVVCPGLIAGVGDLFVTIRWNGLRLSLSGASGPTASGNCKGSCGQCSGELAELTKFYEGWDETKAARLAELWERWHLNDTRAGSPAQEAWLRENPVSYTHPQSHYQEACKALSKAGLHPDPSAGDYRYGSAWKFEEVPFEVIEELFSLPLAYRPHPWGD